MIEWRKVPSFPWLEACSDGRIRRRMGRVDDPSRNVGMEIRGSKNKAGYLMMTVQYGRIRKTNFGIHVLVCEAFHGPKPSPRHEALHGNGVPDHNAESNLRWGTRKDNAADRRKHGRDTVGMKHHSATITDADVIEIRLLKQIGFTGYGLGAMYCLDRNHANKIASGKAWSHLPMPHSADFFVKAMLSCGT